MTREKFEELVIKTRPRMMSVVYKMCRNRIIADDAVQEALVYFLDRIEGGRAKRRYRKITPALMISVAVNRAKNLLRDQDRLYIREYPVGTLIDLDKFVSKTTELDDGEGSGVYSVEGV